MKKIISTLIISCAIYTLLSCEKKQENHNAETAISKMKEYLKTGYQKEADHYINSANARTAFYKSISDLSDDDFKRIYPLIKDWKREARDLSDGEIYKLNEEENALEEKLSNIYKSLSKRVETIEEEI